MNSSVTRTELFEFWKNTDDVGRARERAVVAGVDQRPGLLLFLDLAVDELDDVRVIGVEDHHLGRAARLAAGLDDAGKGVVALHERHRAGGGAAAGQQLARAADLRQVRPGARAELEQHALGRASVRIESIVSLTELMKQAEHCGAFSKPQLNHTGLLKAPFW